MLFSIVIPVYNVEKYLDECVNSILQQVDTIENECEILLIDDGSMDKSGILCDELAKKNSDLIKVFHKDNEGLLLTRRYGFKRASGDYIINCDSDDMIESGMLKAVRQIILKYNKPDIIFINHYGYDGVNKIVRYENALSKEHDSIVPKNLILREYLNGHNLVSMWGKIIKRSCIDLDRDYSKYGKMNTGEDTLQSIEFFANANIFVYLNEALYDYRCGSGMTVKFDPNYYFTFKKIFGLIEKKDWNLPDFDEMFAIKVFQTAGRAITQSRYNMWDSVREHRKYLISICDDSMLTANFKYLRKIKDKLQSDHYILLVLLKKRMFGVIIILLNIKNIITQIY